MQHTRHRGTLKPGSMCDAFLTPKVPQICRLVSAAIQGLRRLQDGTKCGAFAKLRCVSQKAVQFRILALPAQTIKVRYDFLSKCGIHILQIVAFFLTRTIHCTPTTGYAADGECNDGFDCFDSEEWSHGYETQSNLYLHFLPSLSLSLSLSLFLSNSLSLSFSLSLLLSLSLSLPPSLPLIFHLLSCHTLPLFTPSSLSSSSSYHSLLLHPHPPSSILLPSLLRLSISFRGGEKSNCMHTYKYKR